MAWNLLTKTLQLATGYLSEYRASNYQAIRKIINQWFGIASQFVAVESSLNVGSPVACPAPKAVMNISNGAPWRKNWKISTSFDL